MVSKEEFRLTIENRQLKKKLQRIMAEKEQLEREYRELAEFAQRWAERQDLNLRHLDPQSSARGGMSGGSKHSFSD